MSEAAASASSASSYRCLAVVEVPSDQVAAYDQLLCEAASVFTSQRWKLLAATQNADAYDTGGAPPGLVRRLMQVWEIPCFDSLGQVMAYAADNQSYVEAQNKTVGERQNLYVAMRWDSPIGIPENAAQYFMVEILHMVNNELARNQFANYMNNAVYTMYEKYGWEIRLAGNAATGMINEYVNVWAMNDISNLGAAITAYRGDASWSAAVSRVETSMWTPRSLPALGVESGTPTAAAAEPSSATATATATSSTASTSSPSSGG